MSDNDINGNKNQQCTILKQIHIRLNKIIYNYIQNCYHSKCFRHKLFIGGTMTNGNIYLKGNY